MPLAAATIRLAQLGDLDEILELVRGLADFEHLPGPDAAAEARLRADFQSERPPFDVLVAHRIADHERDGQSKRAGDGEPKHDSVPELLGYALSFMTYSTFLARPSLWLEDLFVRPEARRGGVATALLQGLATLALERGCGRFEWSVLDWNEAAQTLYRRLGADILPDWRICRITGDALRALAAKG